MNLPDIRGRWLAQVQIDRFEDSKAFQNKRIQLETFGRRSPNRPRHLRLPGDHSAPEVEITATATAPPSDRWGWPVQPKRHDQWIVDAEPHRNLPAVELRG